MKHLIAFLFLASTCLGQSFGEFTVHSSKESKQEESLIQVSHDKVKPGQEFKVRIKNGLPYKVQPEPRFIWTITEDSGDKVLGVTAGDESLTIVVHQEIVHPTLEELKAAPLFEDKEDWEKWNEERNKDELYHGSRTVLVEGDGPEPDPDPEPDPEPDPDELSDLARKVKELALEIGNKQEIKLVAENYGSIISAIRAGAYDGQKFLVAVNEAIKDVAKLHTEDLAGKENADAWNKFGKELGKLIRDIDNNGGIENLEDLADVFTEVQKGLEEAGE